MQPNWHSNLILVCEKCGKKLEQPGKPNPSHELKNWLKKSLLDRSLWGANRVVTSSCLDVCPEGKVAVAFVSDRPDFESTVEIFDPVTQRDRILFTAVERAKPAPGEP